MKRLLLDVNIILDVLLERSPHSEHAAALWALIETGKAAGLLSAHAVTIVHYLVAQEHDRRRARRAIDRLLSVYTVATVDAEVIRTAMRLGWSDFEDAVTATGRGHGRVRCPRHSQPPGLQSIPHPGHRCRHGDRAHPLRGIDGTLKSGSF